VGVGRGRLGIPNGVQAYFELFAKVEHDAAARAPTGLNSGAEVRLGPSDVEAYENSCRPDAPVCTGCSLGTGCEYDGGNHTTPVYKLSAALTLFR